MMPIREVVIFPHMMTPFLVGRESSVRALEEALAGDKKIFLATQHDASVDEPRPDEIYSVGTVANIVQSLKQADGNLKVLVEGVERGKILSVSDEEGYFQGHHQNLQLQGRGWIATGRADFARHQSVRAVCQAEPERKLRHHGGGHPAVTIPASWPIRWARTCSSPPKRSRICSRFSIPSTGSTRVAEMLDIEIEKLNVDRTVQGRVKRQMEKAQKEYYLNEKIKAIQKELGRGEKSEFDELKKKIEYRGHDQGRA